MGLGNLPCTRSVFLRSQPLAMDQTPPSCSFQPMRIVSANNLMQHTSVFFFIFFNRELSVNENVMTQSATYFLFCENIEKKGIEGSSRETLN